jgi:thiosulfate/3-mercaptopyruvate sulfurtransferase
MFEAAIMAGFQESNMTGSIVQQQVIVSTDWVSAHLNTPNVAIVEVDANFQTGYESGHIPGAIGWRQRIDLEDQVRRDVPGIAQIEALMSRSGIGNDTTVVLYGDGINQSATWAFWVLKYHGHRDLRLMDGGRAAWIHEGRQLSHSAPVPAPAHYRAAVPDKTVRATRDYIQKHLGRSSVKLLDTRTQEEFSGQRDSDPSQQPAGIYRSGRIPGAIRIQWDDATGEASRFKPADELAALYSGAGVEPSNEVITYCRLGVRASYSWFVLKYVLGYPTVRNYDGSWTEWGNAVGVPIESDVVPVVGG